MYVSELKDFMSVRTNLTLDQLQKVANAILERTIEWVHSKDSMMAEYFGTEFYFEGAKYKYEEISESPATIMLVSGESKFIQSLIDQHEKDIVVEVEKRNYDQAKKIYQKVESLKSLVA